MEANRDPVFVPIMAKLYTSVFGEAPNNRIIDVKNRNENTRETPVDQESVTELINKYRCLTPTERQAFIKRT